MFGSTAAGYANARVCVGCPHIGRNGAVDGISNPGTGFDASVDLLAAQPRYGRVARATSSSAYCSALLESASSSPLSQKRNQSRLRSASSSSSSTAALQTCHRRMPTHAAGCKIFRLSRSFGRHVKDEHSKAVGRKNDASPAYEEPAKLGEEERDRFHVTTMT
jgi:hypothetical protein